MPAESAEEGENGAENGATEEGPKKGGNAWTFHFEMFDGYGVWDFLGNRSCRVLLADMPQQTQTNICASLSMDSVVESAPYFLAKL